MKKLFILFISIFISTTTFVQASKLGDVIQVGQEFYILAWEIKGAENNAIFQKNIAIMQRYAQALKDAKEELNKESLTKSDKESLEMKIKELEDIYVANNNAMTKAYNFSVERQYRQDYDDIFVSTYLTDSELDNLALGDGIALDLDKIAEVSGRKVYRQTRIAGYDDVRKFQRELFSFLNRQVELKKLEDQLLESKDAIEKNNISTKISTLNTSLDESQKALNKNYDMIANRNYFIELNNCKLYLLMTPQEIATYRKQKNGK